jgi:hypothetical protein
MAHVHNPPTPTSLFQLLNQFTDLDETTDQGRGLVDNRADVDVLEHR